MTNGGAEALASSDVPITTADGISFDFSRETAALNQFWYSRDTVRALLSEISHHATACAFLSAPSLYFSLMDDAASFSFPLRAASRLFEFDKQWARASGFVHYDFSQPDRVPVQYFAAFDFIVADPPFITESVWRAYVQTAQLLLRPGGKILFTTVLENHTMLEALLDGPLFIAPFRPCIAHLTYQYVCFTNYKATALAKENAELPAEDPKVLAAVQMANDLRESEKAFAAQMRSRDRSGEEPLPAAQHQKDKQSKSAGDKQSAFAEDKQSKSAEDKQSKSAGDKQSAEETPISAMRWGYIPEGLTMYANGRDAPPPDSAAQNETKKFGETFRQIAALRESLDTFKRKIDALQQILDQMFKMRRRRTAPQSEQTAAPPPPADDKENENESEKEKETEKEKEKKRELDETLEEMRGIIADAEAAELRLAETAGAAAAKSYTAAMRSCVEAYAAVPLEKKALSELAADATRRFKSPVFNRMKELLQCLKKLKKEHA